MDKKSNTHALKRCLDVYARHHGDQAVIETMKDWLQGKLGGQWVISKRPNPLKKTR